MANFNYTNVSVQGFWSKYKVIIFGTLSAIFTAFAPVMLTPSHEWDIKALFVAAVIAAATYVGQEARGKNWTVVGQIAAAAIAMAGAYQQDFDLVRVVLAAALSLFSIPLPPVKLSTYEHSEPIVQAKVQAEQIKEVRKGQDKSKAA